MEWQGDPQLEWAVGEVMRDGVLARHLRRAKKVYEARRDCLVGLLAEHLVDTLVVRKPTGGLALWVQGAPGMDLDAFVRAAKQQGLFLHPPGFFSMDGATAGTRMGFSQWDEAHLEEAVQRLMRARAR